MEQWKVIPEYPDYAVSNTGLVRLIVNRHKSKIGFEPKSRITKRGKGYVQIALFNGSDIQYACIHRLVAKAFVPNPLDLPEVNHKKGRLNNDASNLEWRSQAGNSLHAVQNGLRSGDGVAYIPANPKTRHYKARWRPQISINGKQIRLGTFDSYEKAKAVRDAAVAALEEVI